MLGISCYILADTFFISVKSGADGLTALNLVLPVYSVIFAIGSMLGTGAATRFSVLRARNDDGADVYFSAAVCTAVALGVLFMLLGGFFAGDIIELFGGDERIREVGAGYTRIFMLFSPAFMLNYVFGSFVRNDGAPAIGMAATVISSLSNVLMDYIFMFPLDMGMNGAALATGVSPLIGIAICSVHFFTRRNTIRFKLSAPSPRALLHTCRLGASAFVGEISSGVTTMVFNLIILGVAGNVGVAAYGIVANLAIVAIAVFNGVAQGAQPLVSRAYGEGDVRSAKTVLLLSEITAVVFAAMIVTVGFLFSAELTAIFNSEASVQLADHAERGIVIYFVGFLFAAYNIVGTAYLSAVERAASAFAAAVSRGCAAITTFAFLLSAVFGLDGVWAAFPAAELFTALLTTAGLINANKRLVR